MKQKLELSWYNKNKENKIEPRILIENPELSYKNIEDNLFSNVSDFDDNILIHGDNLLSLKALEKEFTNRVKCVYIDPPYNTGSAFEHYDDNLEQSIWLSLMKPRLESMRKLLTENGVIFVQIDDNEQAYLTVLMDEVFGRKNRINTICVNMSNMSGVKINSAINGKRFPKIKEYILIYVKNKESYTLEIPKIEKKTWDNEYNLIIPELTMKDYLNYKNNNLVEFKSKIYNSTLFSLKNYISLNNIEDSFEWRMKNAYRIVSSKPNTALLSIAKEKSFDSSLDIVSTSTGLNKLIRTDFNRSTKTARIELVFYEDNKNVYIGDHWDDIVTTGGVGQEGGGGFPNGKKPEKLISRIIETATKEGDIVLDSFLGSGTTAAVAHKMKRRWIGIELENHAYSHCKRRIDSVIDGKDNTGVTEKYSWNGGGGYTFYELSPTLVKYDAFNQPIINKDYNPDMIASAVALHEGYTYNPNQEVYWKQSFNGENSYLFVTTNHVNKEMLYRIHDDMKEDEYLMLVCKSFSSNLDYEFKNITIKKIPQSLLKNCEFDVDNYNLNIINPPIYEEDDEE